MGAALFRQELPLIPVLASMEATGLHSSLPAISHDPNNSISRSWIQPSAAALAAGDCGSADRRDQRSCVGSCRPGVLADVTRAMRRCSLQSAENYSPYRCGDWAFLTIVDSCAEARQRAYTRGHRPGASHKHASTSESVLQQLCSQHELPKLILAHRKLMKLATNYLSTLATHTAVQLSNGLREILVVLLASDTIADPEDCCTIPGEGAESISRVRIFSNFNQCATGIVICGLAVVASVDSCQRHWQTVKQQSKPAEYSNRRWRCRFRRAIAIFYQYSRCFCGTR